MAQIGRPNGTNLATLWLSSSGNHHEDVDDVVADGDSTFVRNNGGTNRLDLSLPAFADPLSSSDHKLVINCTCGVSGASLAYSLVEGGATVRANFILSPNQGTYTEQVYTLSGAEADSITDYTDLSLWLTTINANGSQIKVTQVYFQVPDASTSNIASVDGVLWDDISTVVDVAKANIVSIDGVIV
jgi:hypothetical protein